MATVENALDVALLADTDQTDTDNTRSILINCSAPAGFRVASGGALSPASITFDAVPLNMVGAIVAWSCTGGTLSTAGNQATLTSGNASSDTIIVSAALTFEGVSYARSFTIQKVYDGTNGVSPTAPNKNAIAFLYKWSTTTPAKPAGTSTFTWAGAANTAYSGGDGWSIAAPNNPGTPLIQLFVATVAVTDAASATATTVGYSASTVAAWAQNGANGSQGGPGNDGAQAGEALVYQWAATIPAGPVGSPSFAWASRTFGAAPTNWSLTPGTSPSAGYTLWQARVLITDTALAVSTPFNWTSASIVAVGYAGTNGAAGTASWVEISTSGGQVFSRADSTAAYTPTSITLTATPYGGSATAYQWQYWTGSAWANLTGVTTASYNIGSGNFTGSRVYRVQATIGGTAYTDEFTLVQLTGGKDGSNGSNGADGANAVVGFLTNESVTVAATSTGTVSGGFGSAGGTFKVFDGLTDKTGNAAVAYSIPLETGVDLSITAAGIYTVNSMSADTGTATLRAVYNGVTIDKTYSIAKAKAGSNGSNGTNGSDGAEGLSYVTAYCASTTASTTIAPAPTTGKASYPVQNGGGITGTWSKSVPALTSGQFLYQSDGIYDPATNTVTWSVPYWSSLKVASLSAITANMGAITAGSIDLGTGATSWHVDSLGNMWIGAAVFGSAPFRVTNGGAVTATNLTITGGAMDIGSGATSFHVDSAGNHWAGAASYASAPYRVSNTGVAVMRGARVEMADGTVVLDAVSPLSEQARANPNLVEAIPSWARTGAAWVYPDINGHARDGKYMIFPAGQSSLFETRIFKLEQNTTYTLSFDGDCYGGSGAISCDLFPDNLPETAFTIAGAVKRYSVTWTTGAQAELANCKLRFFGSPAQQVGIANIKFEQGSKQTAWRDDIVTADNAKNRVYIPNLATLALYAGDIQIGANGAVRQGQTAYNTGIGFYLGAKANGSAAMSIATDNGAKFLCDPENNVLSLTSPVIVNPNISGATLNTFTVSIPGGGMIGSGSTAARSFGTRSVSVSGSYKGALSYLWGIVSASTANGRTYDVYISGSTTGSSVTIAGTTYSQNDVIYADISCTVTDENGVSKVAVFGVNQTFGTGAA